MTPTRTMFRLSGAAMVLSAVSWMFAQDDSEPPASVAPQAQINVVLSSYADELLAACRKARPDDRIARDEATQRLSRLPRLIDAGDERVAWGVLDETKSIEQSDAELVHPLAMVKVYLSLFMFEGIPAITTKDGRTLLEIPATFRDRLMSSEYPEPFWMTPGQWGSYTRTTSLVFVFHGEDLLGVLRRVGPEVEAPSQRAWNGKWEWNDIRGRPQPRVAQLDYVISQENPDATALAAASSALSAKLRAANCLSCHAPDSSPRSGHRTRLHSPLALLAANESLPRLLARTDLASDDPHANHAGGIADDAARTGLLASAEAYRVAVETALAYEAARRAVPENTEPVLPEAN